MLGLGLLLLRVGGGRCFFILFIGAGVGWVVWGRSGLVVLSGLFAVEGGGGCWMVMFGGDAFGGDAFGGDAFGGDAFGGDAFGGWMLLLDCAKMAGGLLKVSLRR